MAAAMDQSQAFVQNNEQEQVAPQPPDVYASHSRPTIASQCYDDSPTLANQENNWQTVESKKRPRSSPDTHTSNIKQKPITEYVTVNSANRFQALSQITDDYSEEAQDDKNKTLKTPPIFIPDVLYINPLVETLDAVAKEGYSFKILGKNQVKVQPTAPENYTKIVKTLTAKKMAFHTYQLKQKKSFRVVIQNIHHTVDIAELTEEIIKKGHIVTGIHNIKHRTTKMPLSMFYVNLKPQENNKSIYDIQFLQNMKVQVEPPHTKREIVQCLRCQTYGHTKSYCNRQPRCVKCGNNHLTSLCTKSKETAATCVLCEGNHPANYKDCIVYKEIQKRKYPLRSKQQETIVRIDK